MPAAAVGSSLGLVAGIFTGTISVGTAIVALILLAVAGYFATRFKLTEIAQKQTEAANEATKVANEATREWRANYVTEKARGDDFEKRYQAERAAKHEVITQLQTEKLKTDQTVVLRALETQMRALRSFHDDYLTRDDEAATVRATVLAAEERMVSQLGEIATQLAKLAGAGPRT